MERRGKLKGLATHAATYAINHVYVCLPNVVWKYEYNKQIWTMSIDTLAAFGRGPRIFLLPHFVGVRDT